MSSHTQKLLWAPVPEEQSSVGLFYSGSLPSYLEDFLSLRLAGVVGARNFREELILIVDTQHDSGLNFGCSNPEPDTLAIEPSPLTFTI